MLNGVIASSATEKMVFCAAHLERILGYQIIRQPLFPEYLPSGFTQGEIYCAD